jgi:Cu-processing system permease protein
VREAIRNKLLYSLLFFTIVLISAGVLISTLSYVERERIVQDVGLAAIRLMSVGIAIFVGVGLIHGEIERRTIYTILSKPVSRVEFLLGKYFGLVATTWLMLAVMGVAFAGISLAYGAPLDAGYLIAFGLIAMELVVIVAVATLFSSFTTPMLSSLFTVGVYVLGHLSRELRQLGAQAEVGGMDTISAVLFELLPDLEAFNVTIAAVHQLPIPMGEVGWATVYGLGYAIAILILASIVFARRDFR